MAQIFKAKTLLASSGKFSYEAIAPNLIYNTGNQNIVGTKTFVSNLEVQGTGIFNALDLSNISEFNFSGTNINLINGNVNISGKTLYISGNAVLTGVDLSSYATKANLYVTGSTLDNKINSLSGHVNALSGLISLTGTNLNNKINSLSGVSVLTFSNQNIGGNKTFIGAVTFSGQEINVIDTALNLSGVGDMTFDTTNINFINSPVFIGGTNLRVSGNVYANNLVYNIENQTISGVKIFDIFPIVSGNKLITGIDLSSYSTVSNLFTTGSTLDKKIDSLSGSSVLLYGDQSIGGAKTFRDNIYINNLFVTGAQTVVSTNSFSVQNPYLLLNLTGGAVDGGIFFVTGAELTGINDNGPIIGFDHSNKFKFGFSSRSSDLSNLSDIASVQNITAYSGFVNDNYATITNLVLTGSALSTNLASTGSNLNKSINSLSGYINSLSANIVFTTGNQIISGDKTFLNNIKVSGSGIFNALDLNNIDTLNLSGVDINISNGNVVFLTAPPIISGNFYERQVNNLVMTSGPTPALVFSIPLLGNKIYEVDQYFKFTTYLANSSSSILSVPSNSISADGYRYGFNNIPTFDQQNVTIVGGVNGLTTFLMGTITGTSNHIRKGILRPNQNCNIVFTATNLVGNQTTLENGSYVIIKRII